MRCLEARAGHVQAKKKKKEKLANFLILRLINYKKHLPRSRAKPPCFEIFQPRLPLLLNAGGLVGTKALLQKLPGEVFYFV